MTRINKDGRLDWRCPNMPVYKMVDGKAVAITPEERQRIAIIKMHSDLPEWREDETYEMRVKK